MLKIIWDWVKKRVSSLWEKIGKDLLLSFLIGTFVLLSALALAVMFSESIEGCVSQLLGVNGAEGVSKKYEVLKALVIVTGGVILVIQAWIANRRAKAMEKQAKAQADSVEVQTEAVREQAKANQATERGRRQDRLKDAIDHLGDDSESVRLGSAHELFQLAQDTPDFRVTVLSILCAHTRQTTGEDKYRKKYSSKPSEEIQSLLTLLFVQDHEVFKGLHINLQGSWLNGVNLNGARLERAALVGVYLQRAQLENSHLQKANLTEARLTLANLRKADLRRANFRKAHLQGACLLDAHLQSACLHWVQMQGVELIGARLQGASLYQVQMQAADLCGARLQLAILGDVKLQASLLGNAQLQAASLQGVQLGGVESLSVRPVEERIRHRIGERGSLVGAVFQGGLSEQDMDSILENVSHEEQSVSRASLKLHIGKPESHQPPEGGNVYIEAYTAEEAEQWIAEYNEAMSEVPEESAN